MNKIVYNSLCWGSLLVGLYSSYLMWNHGEVLAMLIGLTVFVVELAFIQFCDYVVGKTTEPKDDYIKDKVNTTMIELENHIRLTTKVTKELNLMRRNDLQQSKEELASGIIEKVYEVGSLVGDVKDTTDSLKSICANNLHNLDDETIERVYILINKVETVYSDGFDNQLRNIICHYNQYL